MKTTQPNADHYFEVREYNCDEVSFVDLPIRTEPITVGRNHSNTIQILQNTVSKSHAKIVAKNHRHYLVDLGSVNGTFINGKKVGGSGEIITHGDSVQFGKYQCLYVYRDKVQNQRTKSRGKINLKDYLFQEKSEKNEGSQNQNRPIVNPSEGQTKNSRKGKPKEGKIKIPDISNYLHLEPDLDIHRQEPTKDKQQNFEEERKVPLKKKEGKIKLPLFDDQLSQEEKEYVKHRERQRNIFQLQERSIKQLQDRKRKVQEQQLKIEIQKAKNEQQLLQRQLLMEQRVKRQQQRLQQERKKLEDQFLRKEKEKRQIQMEKINQMEKKEKQLMEKFEQQHQRQMQEIKKREQQFKEESENHYKNQYQERKKELQIQAQALAKQYQNIYRETIKKVRNEIDDQEHSIKNMENQVEQISKQNEKIENEEEKLRIQAEKLKKEVLCISGRNRACVLYASELQNKIDEIKSKKNGITFQPSSQGPPKKVSESIVNSRKLLRMKKNQYDALWSEVIALKGSLHNINNFEDVSEYVETIFQNIQMIEKLKEEYLEYIEGEKGIEDIWQTDLEQNNSLQEKSRLYQSEIKKNILEIDENSRDQIKKSTQQRLHMLKIIHMCSEQKKNAAKFLIQQMLSIEQEIHKYTIENEEIHKKIVQLILKAERIKKENEGLSEMLFGHDEQGHHFDNMKVVINTLIDKISLQKDTVNVANCLKLNHEGQVLELKLQEQSERKKNIKEQMRKISQMGLSPLQIKKNEKNPLIFFGDLLTNRQLEIDEKKMNINTLENSVNLEKEEIRLLEQKRRKISQNLQKFKQQQLSNAKRYLV